MRYTCPSCNRVFYLDAKTQSPCPACGSMLQLQEEGVQAAAQPAEPEQAETFGGGETASWLGSEAETVRQPAAGAPVPSASSWLSPGAVADQAAQQYAPEEQAASASPQAEYATSVASKSGPMSTSAYRQTAGARTSSSGPAGVKIFFITAVSVIVAAAAAVLILVVAKPSFLGSPAKEGPVVTADSSAELDQLRKELNDKKDELATLRMKAAEERRELEGQLAHAKGELDNAKGGAEHTVNAATLMLEASTLLERRSDLTEALNRIDAALKADASLGIAHRVRGRILAAKGRSEEALAALEEADRLSKEAGKGSDALALVLAGEVCLTDLADRAKAAQYYKRAAAAENKSEITKIAEARALQMDGEWERATEQAMQARKDAPSLALAPLLMGEITFDKAMLSTPPELRKPLLESAGKLLAEAVRLDPNSARACLMHGRLLLEEAKRVASGPGFGVMRLGRQSQAERLLSHAMSLSPTWAEVHLALAGLRLEDGALQDPFVALTRATEAVRLTNSGSASALATLAKAQAATGNPRKAAASMQEALKIDPKNTEYLSALRRYEADAKVLKQ